MRTLYIHAGAHKTASSMLQTALRHNKDLLMEKGLRVIFRSQVIKRDLQKCLYKIKNDEVSNEIVQCLKEDLEKILPKKEVDCLITNEDIFSTINLYDFYRNIDVSLSLIKETMENLGWSVKFIFFVRSQADYIESVYLQHIHIGRTVSFEEFLDGQLPNFLSWKEMVDKAVSVLGEDNVKVEPFECIKEKGGEGFYFDFLNMVGVENLQGLKFDEALVNSRGANRSYSMLAVKIANRVNSLLNQDEKNIFREFLQEYFSTATHQRARFLSDQQKESLMSMYNADNKELFDHYISRKYNPINLGYCIRGV